MIGGRRFVLPIGVLMGVLFDRLVSNSWKASGTVCDDAYLWDC